MEIDETELTALRRAFARQVVFTGGSQNPDLERAFAEVRREDFLGPGPWPIFQWTGYRPTPDADPSWLCADNLVGLVPERGLNNGQPSAHAGWIAAAAPHAGDHVVHVGAGVGYYSAILGHMAGPSGRLTAIEYDPALAARAAANLAGWPNAEVIQGDGSAVSFDPADVIYVNAGASRPADRWLDGLKDGGRMILPLTTDANFPSPSWTRPTGAVFRITRRGEAFDADFVSGIAVFPCEGMRDPESEAALAAAFRSDANPREVKRLHRHADLPDADCWVKANGWSLAYR